LGELLGPCKKCSRLLLRPHPSGICEECRKKDLKLLKPDTPDLPDPLKF